MSPPATCLVVCTAALVGTATGYGPELPDCPPGWVFPAVCQQSCYSDRDCRPGDFCCRAGCYITCVPKPKPGICPVITRGPCEGNACDTDQQCPGNQKCCGKPGCKGCYRPEKPGTCPKRKNSVGVCVAYCDGDFDCPGDQKCCGGCPRQCCEKPCYD